MLIHDDNVTPDVIKKLSFELETAADGKQSTDTSLQIDEHKFKEGILLFTYKLFTGESEFYKFTDTKQDYPDITFKYILQNDVGTSRVCKGRNRYASCSRTFNWQYKNSVRRTIRLYESSYLPQVESLMLGNIDMISAY